MFQESHGRQQSPRPLCARALLVRAACTATASTDPPLYPCSLLYRLLFIFALSPLRSLLQNISQVSLNVLHVVRLLVLSPSSFSLSPLSEPPLDAAFSSLLCFFVLSACACPLKLRSLHPPPFVMLSSVPQMVPGADEIMSRWHLHCQQSSPPSEYEKRQMLRTVAQVM